MLSENCVHPCLFAKNFQYRVIYVAAATNKKIHCKIDVQERKKEKDLAKTYRLDFGCHRTASNHKKMKKKKKQVT